MQTTGLVGIWGKYFLSVGILYYSIQIEIIIKAQYLEWCDCFISNSVLLAFFFSNKTDSNVVAPH